MLTQVLTATFSLFSEEPLLERRVVAPRVEELPEIARAARNHSAAEEILESRLFMWLDH